MRRLVVLVLIAWVAGPAAAQTTTDLAALPTDGLEQLSTSVALADGADAIVVNPAGLGMARGLTLRYLHQEGVGPPGDWRAPNGDGLYVAARLFRPFSLGFATEWLRHRPGIGDLRRTTWSLALGDETFSLGAGLHLFSADDDGLDGLRSFDLGAASRPLPWLSVGFAVRDVGSPRLHGADVPRSFVGAVGLRPIGDWLTLGVEGVVRDGDGPGTGFDAMRLGQTAQVRLLDGLYALGAISWGVDGEGPFAGQVGLRVDFDHLGLAATPLFQGDSDPGSLVAVELRSAAVPGIGSRHANVADVRLSQALSSDDGLRLLPGNARLAMLDVLEGLRRLGSEPGLDAVLLRIDDLPDVGQGEAWELREAILALRERGKRVVVLLEGGGDTEYRVASAADHVLVTPEATLFINGFATRVNFFADTLDLVGVRVDAVQIGAYKNAPDLLTRDSISPSHEEVVNDLLDDLWARYLAELQQSRGLDEAAAIEALDTGIQSASLAQSLGLVDGSVYPDELESELRSLLGTGVRLQRRGLRPREWTSWGKPPVVAIIPIEGTITGGRTGGDFGLVQTTGARTVVEALERASSDPRVRAIVLRIDSGGGDAAGSQRIWRAVGRAAQRKPVVATMGDSAASGGYYAAAAADRIYAAPDTFTGSIGIFWLKPDLAGLLDKLHVGSYRSVRSDLADLGSVQDDWNEAERAAMERHVEAGYQAFLEAVADGRGLTVEEVHELAQGRVWTGAQARERGLVDELGGLAEALAWAREEAGLAPDEAVDFRVYRPAAALLGVSDLALSVQAPPMRLPETLESLLGEALPPALLLPGETGLWTLAPFHLEVR